MKRAKLLRRSVLTLVLAVMALLLLLPAKAEAANLSPSMFVGTSWYGENMIPSFTGNHLNYYAKSYCSITIDTCDANGNFTFSEYNKSEEKNSYYVRLTGTGHIDFSNGTIRTDERVSIHDIASGWRRLSAYYSGTVDANHLYLVYNITERVDQGQTFTMTYSRMSQWASEEVVDADSKGLLPETLYGEDLTQPITRAEFAAVSVRLYEALSGKQIVVGAMPFRDVSRNKNIEYIQKAYAANITIGTSPTTFDPDIDISREQLATMLTRALKKYKYPNWTFATDDQYILDTSGTTPYADDADISAYAKPSVYYLTANGIVHGIGNNRFAPRAVTSQQAAEGYATATREQAVAMALRVYNKKELL